VDSFVVFLCVVGINQNEKDLEWHLSLFMLSLTPRQRKEWIIKIRRDPGPDFKITKYKNLLFAFHTTGLQVLWLAN